MKRTALVTGASGGIGLALAECFARDGVAPVLVARSEDRLRAAAETFAQRYAVEPETIALDLGLPGAAERLYDEVMARGCEVEFMVNNAGFATYGAFAEIPLRDEREELMVNVVALTELTKLFLPGMLERGRGRVLNVASTAAFQPGPLMAVYYASKAYVLSFSEALAEELRGSAVTVTCLAPGATASGFQERAKMQEAPLVRGRRLPAAAGVAEAGYRGMLAGRRLVVPGTLNKVGTLLPRITPRGLVLRVSRALLAR